MWKIGNKNISDFSYGIPTEQLYRYKNRINMKSEVKLTVSLNVYLQFSPKLQYFWNEF